MAGGQHLAEGQHPAEGQHLADIYGGGQVKVKVAVAQFDASLGRVDENMLVIRSLVTEAASRGARLVVLPEMATTGYLFRDRAEALPCAEPVPGPCTERLASLCRERSIYIVAGLLEVDASSGFLYNTAVLAGPDGYVGKYRKTHPFFADTRWAVDGDMGFPVYNLPFGRVGIMVCMDVSYFEVARMLSVAGAQIIAFPLNSRQPAPAEQWSVRAVENSVYLLAANRTGFERGTRFSGGSAVLAPDGKVLVSLGDEAGVVISELDTSLCGRDHLGYGAPVPSRRPEAYYALVLSPYAWASSEVYGLGAGGKPSIAAVSYAGTSSQLRNAAGRVWQRFALAEKGKPDVIVFPEKCLVDELGRVAAVTVDEALAWSRQATVDMNCALGFGFLEKGAGPVFNVFAFVAPDGTACLYRQVHVPPAEQGSLGDQDSVAPREQTSLAPADQAGVATERASVGAGGPANLAAERGRVAAGESFRVLDTAWGRVGLAVGADLFYPETLACLAQMGADIVVAGIRSPAGPVSMMIRERARAFNVHVAVAQLDRAPLLVSAAEAGVTPSETNLGLDAGLGTGDVAWAAFDCTPASIVRLKPAMKRRRPELYHTLAVRQEA
ncbi:MAG: nitrilase-related carbon-nitrogen hydrolase [Bacillota bacterium]|nr:nitrilase-related carbon-nitrogen hydrolase [Bacillota bacterium]